MIKHSLSFANRREAGRKLARVLHSYAGRRDVVVLGLPRGGVPVAYEVALALGVPLDVSVVRKLGVPGQEGLAIGAIASGGSLVLNEVVCRALEHPQRDFERVVAVEEIELGRQEQLFAHDRGASALTGRIVILVDDWLASGASMRAAIQALQDHRPARCVMAVPAVAPDACASVSKECDEVVCLTIPEHFQVVERCYADFARTTDEEVCRLLTDARQSRFAPAELQR